MISDAFSVMLAFIRNWSSTSIFKLFYEEGYVDLYIYDDNIKKVRKVSVPTIKQIIKSSVGIDDIITGAYVAGEYLEKYDLVYFNPDDFKIYKASNLEKDKANVLGIVLSNANAGDTIEVKTSGTVTLDYDLPFSIGDTLYLDNNGKFTNSIPPVNTYITRIGTVTSYREIDINISEPIYNGG